MKKLVLILLFFTAINALVAGMLFMLSPDGRYLGMDVSYIGQSPFKDYLIPGLVLFLFNGVFNLIAAILLIRNHSRSWQLVAIQGLILMLWIATQVYFVHEFNPLHGIMLAIGIVLLVSALIKLRPLR